ncbi:hypothetical protein JTE90_022460 [Oedothorax gibbosus]|uniref:Cytochrome P450 n=1 Tax=Oedothorax gibbosus TaxID=931172 RepID=A0AAV6TUW0_9ARAC|nr:hypothetical protein JTE90_022460 [Oedothorax gibbosus]
MVFESFFRVGSLEDFDPTTRGLLVVVVTVAVCGWLWNLWNESKTNRPPGPWFSLPFVGHLPYLGKDPHVKLWDLRKKYGDIIGVKFGTKYTVVLNEWNVMREVLCNSAALDRAPNLFDHIPKVGFISENGEKWVEQRRFCLAATRDLGLGRGHWEDLIMEETADLISHLKSFQGRPMDISHEMASSISSNIIALLIGRRLNKNVEGDKIQLSVDFSDVSFSFMGPSNPTSVVPGLRTLCETLSIAGYGKAMKVIREFSTFVNEEIALHKTSPMLKDVRDFMNTYLETLSKLTSSNNTKHYFSETMLEGNVKILFLGSSDTIFSSLGWLLRLMSLHKDVQQKVYQEVMEVAGKDGRVRYEERNKFPYTFAVVMESQRKSSIVPLSTTRRAAQDIHINGFTIPKGSEIVANLWGLHSDPKYWENPEEFRPERFLTDGGTKLIRYPPSFAPFSTGRRNCPGETIAWMEILYYFTEILKNFEVTTPPGVKPEFEIINGLVEKLVPQPLCFIPRKDVI